MVREAKDVKAKINDCDKAVKWHETNRQNVETKIKMLNTILQCLWTLEFMIYLHEWMLDKVD